MGSLIGVIAEVASAPSISYYSQLQSHLGLGPASSASISSANPTATLITGIPTALHVKSSNPTWILDSGANNHMTGELSILSSPVTPVTQSIRIVDGPLSKSVVRNGIGVLPLRGIRGSAIWRGKMKTRLSYDCIMGDPLIDHHMEFVMMLEEHGLLVVAQFDEGSYHAIKDFIYSTDNNVAAAKSLQAKKTTRVEQSMINPKRLIEMARKWQKISAMGRRRISLPRSDGHFVVYTIDKKRFVVPLRYLNHNIFRELFRMSEEEFGLPGDGPITLPCDAFFMEYVVLLSSLKLTEKVTMINSKRLAIMARKWQNNLAAMGRRRISLPKTTDGLTNKGHFIVYTTDDRRFVVPLAYLRSHIFRELFRMSEEEFGLPSDGPIILPCDAVCLEYVVSMVRGRVCKDLEKALLISLASGRCLASSSLPQEQRHQQIVIHGF
ncbi:hypothetical protein HHK36_002859 [Tetracentron sinense]|uniref:Small auxin up regulated protein n=1 Tax=Tetracentron sinense TaxID=13715 RepID=A0A834ZX92_TETSI|nr:hypothetical protein HHK36_002859 [Tetracentron sinense]